MISDETIPGVHELGCLSDRTTGDIPYRSKELTASDYGPDWPFGNQSILLVRPPVHGLAMFVFDGQGYAANGYTQIFARKWELELEIDGEKQPISKYEGVVGDILKHIFPMWPTD